MPDRLGKHFQLGDYFYFANPAERCYHQVDQQGCIMCDWCLDVLAQHILEWHDLENCGKDPYQTPLCKGCFEDLEGFILCAGCREIHVMNYLQENLYANLPTGEKLCLNCVVNYIVEHWEQLASTRTINVHSALQSLFHFVPDERFTLHRTWKGFSGGDRELTGLVEGVNSHFKATNKPFMLTIVGIEGEFKYNIALVSKVAQ